MSDERLRHKIDEARAMADRRGLDLEAAPLLVTFDMPIRRTGVATREITELARAPSTAVAVTSPDPLEELRKAVAKAPNVHLLAERGLVCSLTGGATVHLYPTSEQEMRAFAVALFTGVAPAGVRIALGGHLSSGRQEVTFEGEDSAHPLKAIELMHALRHKGADATMAGGGEDAVVIDDLPKELEALRAALAEELPGRGVRVLRMASGRFRITPDHTARAIGAEKMQVLSQQIAVSSDRAVEARGPGTFAFATAPVAGGDYGPESGARHLASELFGRPDTVVTHLGLETFAGEGTLCFAYERSEAVWDAANKGIAFIPVRDIREYARILHAIRLGE
ncbi:MAG: hypothetical protein ACYTGV_15780 [Planctomycetota bacterium]|jgi:hypothetical protein